MTDHGEHTSEARLPRTSPVGAGPSFTDAWAAATLPADPEADSLDLEAGTAAPARADSAGLLPASLGATAPSSSADQGVSVTVRRPPRADLAASGSEQRNGDGDLTVEVRRAGHQAEAGQAAERIVVTVSLGQSAQQVVVTL